MDAMVFAAGLGIRLRPLTDSVPKALVRVGGVSVLERAVRRIAEAGADRIVVNAHHHIPLVERELVRLRDLSLRAPGVDRGRPVDLLLSAEAERPLETGGGLRRAAPMFHGDRPILLHNGDVISGIDLGALREAHDLGDGGGERRAGRLVATLAVQARRSSRQLLFDAFGLYGRRHVPTGRTEIARDPRGARSAFAFAGIHVVSPRLLGLLPDEEVFSITDAYLRLAARGERVVPHVATDAPWWEIGTEKRLEAARTALGD